MTNQASLTNVRKLLLLALDETFSKIHGIYLDKGTEFFSTLASITAAEASSAASPQSATIAAQLDHVRLYLDVINNFLQKKTDPETNWSEIWETVRGVTPEEWEALKQRFKESHARVMATINSLEDWSGEHEFGGALAVLIHTAYHLGGIRQALGAIRAGGNTQ
jgi:hypothetical protein